MYLLTSRVILGHKLQFCSNGSESNSPTLHKKTECLNCCGSCENGLYVMKYLNRGQFFLRDPDV